MNWILLCLTGLVFSRPNGAPQCTINEEGIFRGMRTKSDMSLGYSVEIKKEGNEFAMHITSMKGRPDYQGILMYVSSPAVPKTHLGRWSFKNATKWKYQDENICKAAGVAGPKEATVTHANADRVLIANQATFTWTPDAGLDLSQAMVNFIVASRDEGKTSGFARWVRFNSALPDVGPSRTAGGPTPPPGERPAGAAEGQRPAGEGAKGNSTEAVGPGGVHIIKVGDGGLKFNPEVLQIKVGDTVKWEFSLNPESIVQAEEEGKCEEKPNGFKEEKKIAPAVFEQTFKEKGEIFYFGGLGKHCELGMRGKILVGIEGEGGNATRLSSDLKLGTSVGISLFALITSFLL